MIDINNSSVPYYLDLIIIYSMKFIKVDDCSTLVYLDIHGGSDFWLYDKINIIHDPGCWLQFVPMKILQSNTFFIVFLQLHLVRKKIKKYQVQWEVIVSDLHSKIAMQSWINDKNHLVTIHHGEESSLPLACNEKKTANAHNFNEHLVC
jgi:hypothetical protein